MKFKELIAGGHCYLKSEYKLYDPYIIDASKIREKIEDLDNYKFHSGNNNMLYITVDFPEYNYTTDFVFMNYENHPEIVFQDFLANRDEYMRIVNIWNAMSEESKLKILLSN